MEWRENVTGKLADSLFTVQRASICSPTGQSPNLNTGLGEMDKSTGNAVPWRATSTLEPIKEQHNQLVKTLGNKLINFCARKGNDIILN